MADARVTTSGAYIETDPVNEARATGVGAYVETDPVNEARVTAVGAYIERRIPPRNIAAGNVSLSYAGTALDRWIRQVSLTATVKPIDTSDLDSAGEERIAGVPTWVVELGGKWHPTLDAALGPDAVGPPATLRDMIVGFLSVRYAWSGDSEVGAFVSDYSVQTDDPNESIKWSATLTCSGNPTRSA